MLPGLLAGVCATLPGVGIREMLYNYRLRGAGELLAGAMSYNFIFTTAASGSRAVFTAD